MNKKLIYRLIGILAICASIVLVFVLLNTQKENNEKYKDLEVENQALKTDYQNEKEKNDALEEEMASFKKQTKQMKERMSELEELKSEIYKKVDDLPINLSNEWDSELNVEDMSRKNVSSKEKIENLEISFNVIGNQLEEAKTILKYTPNQWPANSQSVSSTYGGRTDPVYQTSATHKGIDIAGSTGEPVYASGEGTIIYSGQKGGYGNAIVINHGNGYETLYGHMSKLNVKQGETVKKGDTIGLIGSTGKSTGPHLHFEIHENGSEINPINFIKKYD